LILENSSWRVWTGFIWVRISTSGGLFWTRKWTFWFHKRREISWLAQLLKKDSAPWR
jgi:hypothetical protein